MVVMFIYVCLYAPTYTYLCFLMFYYNQFLHTIKKTILKYLLGQVRSKWKPIVSTILISTGPREAKCMIHKASVIWTTDANFWHKIRLILCFFHCLLFFLLWLFAPYEWFLKTCKHKITKNHENKQFISFVCYIH